MIRRGVDAFLLLVLVGNALHVSCAIARLVASLGAARCIDREALSADLAAYIHNTAS